jgi:hypothetical protein
LRFVCRNTKREQNRVFPVPFRIGITHCKQGGTGSSDRFCPPIEGEQQEYPELGGFCALAEECGLP